MSRETRQHAMLAALTLAVCLLLSAMAGPIDKGGIDCGKLWQAAHERAVREVRR